MRATFALALVLAWFATSETLAATCPGAGADLTIELLPPAQAQPSSVRLTGELLEASCESQGTLADAYDLLVECADASRCSVAAAGLAPGLWVHRISVTAGQSARQRQARQSLLLDRSAGRHTIRWDLFRTVTTVVDLGDAPDCEGCLREALELSAAADKPMWIGFDPEIAGDVVLADQLPALEGSQVTVDGFDFDGVPHRRGIDAGGLPYAALRITGGANRVAGLRLANSGANADVLLIDGSAANDNRVESVRVVGRTLEVCERRGRIGCVLDGACSVPSRLSPNGDCGDDGIAVRDDAGRLGANHLVDVTVTGAYDKGIKISDGAVAVLRRSRVHANSDGGIQATLGGTLTAEENVSESNRGTRGANGLAANGPRLDGSDPASLTTRGNLLRDNALRGLSVRSRSYATLRDDFVCGNGTVGTGAGFGLALLNAAGFAAAAHARGIALVHNVDGGVATMGSSTVDLGTAGAPGANAFAFNGVESTLEGPTEVRNLTALPISAIGNYWETCGPSYECTEIAVLIGSVYAPHAPVEIVPARANAELRAPVIHEIRPAYARAGELVWIYGEGFDAVGAAAADLECDGAGRPCRASDPNCVLIDRQGAEIVAATPTLLVIRAPFTCVEPVKLIARTRYSRGYARTRWCRIEE